MLLDAAAFVPTNRLDLSRWQPDFVALSFYKMFGYPTGVGCLSPGARRWPSSQRPWFSGGTIVAAFVGAPVPLRAGAAALRGRHAQLPRPARGRDRPAPPRAASASTRSTPTSRRSARAARRRSTSLRHTNGAPAATVYGRATSDRRGATIAFNFLHPAGASSTSATWTASPLGTAISLRTGCFCNPGAGEVAFSISPETLLGGEFGDGMTLDDYMRAIGLHTGGAVRASLGIASNSADIERFFAFAGDFVDLADTPDDLPARAGC